MATGGCSPKAIMQQIGAIWYGRSAPAGDPDDRS
jgi:hypothetical protein